MRLIWFAFFAGLPVLAQGYYPRHNLNLGLGAGMPGADLRVPFSDSVGMGVNYGYRFHRYFQAEIGFDTLFGAARIRDFLPTEFGDRRIRDYQILLPFGGRAILPLAGGRLLVSGGGGGAYMRYQERISQPSEYVRLDCPVCTARHGVGYYALLGASVSADRGQRFWIGVTTRVYRGHTDGDPLGPVPGVRTRDHWVTAFGEFGVSF